MAALPAGTVTFFLTDVEGSTRRWEADRTAMSAAMADLDRVVAETVDAHSGHLIKSRGEGDAHFCVFARATDAIAAAVSLQRRLQSESGLPLRVAIHTGDAELRDGDYYGTAVNRAARIRALAHGGQVVVSSATADIARPVLDDGVTLIDLGEHALKDLAAPERVWQVAADGLRADFAPLSSAPPERHNLPEQLTSLVGREHHVAEVGALVEDGRLTTLTGAGGSGKTRLAVEVGLALLDRFADGVWFVDLAATNDPDAVPMTAASALGVRPREGSGRPIRDELLEHVRDRELLVILDNCEHLIAECAELATALLKSGRRVRVLATSREALGVPGEAIWLVPSLEVEAAIELFAQRARLKRREFTVSDDNRPHVEQICLRLDGIPLAIELAAAKVALLSAEQIAARLDDRFRLLTGGGRSVLARQQTLQATIDWSYGLLSGPEQRLLRQLSVFSGGFTLEAAEVVGAVDEDAVASVLDDLSELVAKSLVVATASPGGDTRYSLLETVRQYAAVKLMDEGEAAAARDRHQDWAATLAHDVEARLNTREQATIVALVDTEIDNLRTAAQWGGRDRAVPRLEIVAALASYWHVRGGVVEAHQYAASAIEDAGDAVSPSLLARILARVALMVEATLLHDDALRCAERVLELDDVLTGPDRKWLAWALSVVARAREPEGPDAWEPIAARSLAEARGAGMNAFGLSALLYRYAGLQLRCGRWDVGLPLFEESAAYAREAGVPSGLIRTLNELALHALFEDDQDRAAALVAEAYEAARGINSDAWLATSIGMRALVEGRRGNFEAARALEDEATRHGMRAGGSEWGNRNAAGYNLMWAGDLAGADDQFRLAMAAAEAAESPHLANVLHSRAECRLLMGDLDMAAALLARAASATADSGLPGHVLLHDTATVARLRGDYVAAATGYLAALDADRDRTRPEYVRQSLTDIAATALATGAPEVGARLMAAVLTGGTRDVFMHLLAHTKAVAALARAAAPDAWADGTSLSIDGALAEARAFCRSLLDQAEA